MKLEYSVVGDGNPILVFHGGHSNCKDEFGYEKLIEEGFSIITPSRAGYGETSSIIGENLNLACKAYVKLLDYLNIEKGSKQLYKELIQFLDSHKDKLR